MHWLFLHIQYIYIYNVNTCVYMHMRICAHSNCCMYVCTYVHVQYSILFYFLHHNVFNPYTHTLLGMFWLVHNR